MLPASSRWAARSGALAIAGFCTVLVGVNLPNPLIPLYTTHYGLTALAQSAVFSVYLLALVITLVAAMRLPDGYRQARHRLVLALGFCAVCDLLMALGADSLGSLVAGRIVAGVSVGLATGSAATLALAGLGERARTAVATGAVVGSLLGNVGGGLFGSVLPAPTLTVYAGHLVAAVLVGVGTLLSARWPTAEAAVATGSSRSPDAPPRCPGEVAADVSLAVAAQQVPQIYRTRHRRAGILLGAMAWSVAGVILALVPAAVRALLPSVSLLGAVLPGGLFLAVAWLAQLSCRRRLLRLRAWQVSIPMVAGLGLVGVALGTGRLGLLLVGAALCGLGQGPAYSLGLATVTHGLRAERQGRVASAYAAVAYAACGTVTTATGAVALSSTVPSAIGTLTVVVALAALVAVAFAGAPQRLPEPEPVLAVG